MTSKTAGFITFTGTTRRYTLSMHGAVDMVSTLTVDASGVPGGVTLLPAGYNRRHFDVYAGSNLTAINIFFRNGYLQQ
jgi:hypothetical protein